MNLPIERLLRRFCDHLQASRAAAAKMLKTTVGYQNIKSKIADNIENKSPPLQEQLAELINLYNQGKFNEFLSRAEPIAKYFPQSFEIHIMLAEVNRKLNHYDAAINSYQMALNIKPDYTDAYINMGSVFKNNNQLNKAYECYQKVLKIKPGDPEAYYNMGNTLQAKGKLDAAIECYRKALNTDPNYVEAYNNMGTTLVNKGELGLAIDNYKKALVINPNDAELYYNVGNALQNKGDPTNAIIYYQKAICNEPEYANAYNNLAITLKNIGDLDAAIECYEKLIKIKPKDANAYYNMGISLRKKGELATAIKCYKKALKLKPDYAEAYNNMGAALLDMFEFNQAIEYLQKALKIKPDYAEAHYNIGNALQDKGELTAAIISFKKALQLKPNYDEVKHILAALTGENTTSAPRAYVENLFDSCAFKFDHSLVVNLEYHTPKILAEMVVANHSHGALGSILDLGCGTGLAGAEFKKNCRHLEGVDLSKLMIEQAQRKNIFDKLTHSDVIEYLSVAPLDFDYFISTDAFIYVGDLSDVFRLIKSRNMRNGKLAFSTEHTDKEGFFLEPTGRYSHSKMYIEDLCKMFDYQLNYFAKTNLRKEKDGFVVGALYLLDF